MTKLRSQQKNQSMILATKLFLSLVGIMYIGLCVWCSLAPETTSKKVGFDLLGGSGSSEFLVIYGGLELAMGLVFLSPWLKEDWLGYALFSCILIHGCLAIFRTIGFFLYSDIGSLTYKLAIGEWHIFVLSIGLTLWYNSIHE